jgi:hypothetical protein
MKKLLLTISLLALIPLVSSASSFKIYNDTGSKVSIHTGSGVANLNKGSSTSVSCRTGKKVHTASRGTKDRFLFKITSSTCGTTVRLSSVM